MKILIQNAKIVNEGQITEQDIYIREGRIEKIDNKINLSANETIDASGLYLIPGMIDDQVHFREPGLTHKAEIKTESMAAVAGGITSFMEMPNTNPLTDSTDEIKKKLDLASLKSYANYAFYLGATNNNLENIKKINPNLICGVKVFMGSSTGNMLVDDPETLSGIFEHSPVLIATHCEYTPIIEKNEQLYLKKFGPNLSIHHHGNIRSREACLKSSSLAVELAHKYQSNLHVLHITTKDELSLFNKGYIDNKKITAEVCVHHLSFSEEDYHNLGSYVKCNPSVKTEEDRQALLRAVNEDCIDIIATDHAPHTKEEKQQTYFKAPSGIPLVHHALLKLLDFYHQDIFSLEKIVEKTSHNVAKRFEIKERGFIREGYWADLVLVDLNQKYEVTEESLLYKCKWSPFIGQTFNSRIISTFVNGYKVFDQNKVHSEKNGRAIEFSRV